MTLTDAHVAYLEILLRQTDLSMLASKQISVIVTGSSADYRADEHSDWDFKIFAEASELSEFTVKYGARFSISDNSRNPQTFLLVRPFEYLESEFKRIPVMAMWIYEHARVLRDDGHSFIKRIHGFRKEFDCALPDQIQRHYLDLRTVRHGIDSVVKRFDDSAARMLAQECIKISLQVLCLVHSKPYPYLPWLQRVSKDEYLHHYPELFRIVEEFGLELKGDHIETWSRELVNTLIDLMVPLGFDRSRLEQWWLHI